MWEEHPACQKAQAAGMGVGLLLWFLVVVGYSIRNEDWALLRFSMIAGAVLAVVAVASWAGAKLIRRIRAARSSPALAASNDRTK